jgi:hypothetical protein
VRAGEAISDLIRISVERNSIDWFHVAYFLDHQSRWRDEKKFATNSAYDLETLSCVVGMCRIYFRQIPEYRKLNDKVTFEYLQCAAKGVDWKNESSILRLEIQEMLGLLRPIVKTQAVKLRGDSPSWHAAAIFLNLFPDVRKGTLSGCHTKKESDCLKSITEQCWPDLIPKEAPRRSRGPKQEKRTTSLEPFNPLMACDPEPKVYTPGSGQTHKPGAWNDHRGHR